MVLFCFARHFIGQFSQRCCLTAALNWPSVTIILSCFGNQLALLMCSIQAKPTDLSMSNQPLNQTHLPCCCLPTLPYTAPLCRGAKRSDEDAKLYHVPVDTMPMNKFCCDCVCPAIVCAVDKLAQAGVQHIVYWSAEQPGPQLIAAHFGHVFATALQIPSTTVPEVCSTVICQQVVAPRCSHAEVCCMVTADIKDPLCPKQTGASVEKLCGLA